MRDRHLDPAEARLFKEGTCGLVEAIIRDREELELDTEVNVAVFDDLEYEQKLAMLELPMP
jgi:hypothetical protein